MTQNGSGRSLVVTPDGVTRRLEVYSVGILREIQISFRRRKYCLHLKSLFGELRRREWQNANNTFNGYLAELEPWPENMPRCGSGWTKIRAQRDIARRIEKASWS